jgi:serine/threonine-protein kinase
MGEVWLASHALLGRQAAIKLLHPSFTAREDIVTRFFNEARAATAIADPGIVQIFDFGYAGATAYIVMELLAGETLDARLRTRVLSVTDALRIVRQVASSLGAAHGAGIIHRDLKPENIFLVRDPEVIGGERAKILDFGIAKLAEHDGPKTVTAAVMGTPTYMSPEQCRGAGRVDARADVYSLGCVLFTILTGHPPFLGEGIGDLIVKHMSEPAPPISSHRPDVSPAVEALIARCLEKDPSRRYASGSELALAIGELLGAAPAASAIAPTIVPAVRAPAVATTLTGASGVTAAPATGQRPRSGARIAIAGLGAAVLAAGVAAVMATRGDAPAASASTASASDAAAAPFVEVTMDAAPLAFDASEASPAGLEAAAPPVDDSPARAERQLAALAVAFTSWAPKHVGQTCPRARDLGAGADPWGSPWVVSCADQPARQIIGVVSAGPDRTLGTADDLRSWNTPSVARLLAGRRWTPKPARAVRSSPPRGLAEPKASTHEPPKPSDDHIPTTR